MFLDRCLRVLEVHSSGLASMFVDRGFGEYVCRQRARRLRENGVCGTWMKGHFEKEIAKNDHVRLT
jgi:hypothetical protein